jgi:hypothetical protein
MHVYAATQGALFFMEEGKEKEKRKKKERKKRPFEGIEKKRHDNMRSCKHSRFPYAPLQQH